MNPAMKRFLSIVISALIFTFIMNNRSIMSNLAQTIYIYTKQSTISNFIPTMIMASIPYIIESIIGKLR